MEPDYYYDIFNRSRGYTGKDSKGLTAETVINNVLNEFIRQQKEHTEKELAEIITKYDFAVGSIELKQKLMEILPEGANIICSPYIESPTTIYAIKKFDTKDLLFGQQKKQCLDCSYYGKFSLDCGRCDDCSMFEPKEGEEL